MSHQQMLVSTLGLSAKDQAMLASVFKLAAQLRTRYRMGKEAEPTADVVFVNADDGLAIAALRQLRDRNSVLTPIMVTSAPVEHESAVCIRRPLVIKRILAALESASLTNSRPSRGLGQDETDRCATRILIVDDSFPVRKFMEQKVPLLAPGEVALSFAASGEEAIAKVKAESPGLVFLDVMMPGVDGYKVCKWIKSVRPETRVAMLTGKTSPFNKARGAMSGCDAYLTKPPSDQRLSHVLSTLLARQSPQQDTNSDQDQSPARAHENV